MKKAYVKPMLVCEDLHPEQMLCRCDLTNPLYSDLEMCTYPIDAPGTNTVFLVFGESWVGQCQIDNKTVQTCYHTAETSIFSS